MKLSIFSLPKFVVGLIRVPLRLHFRDGGPLPSGPIVLVQHAHIFEPDGRWVKDCPATLRFGTRGDKTFVWCWRCERIIKEIKPQPNLNDLLLEVGVVPLR